MEVASVNIDIPAWALRAVTPEDRELTRISQEQGRTRITWPDIKMVRAWAKKQGWPTPFWSFQKAFLARMLEDDEAFKLALKKSGIKMQIPVEEYTLSGQAIKELDALYEERSSLGRPTSWGSLVRELREIRRAVEAGVKVKIEGTETILRSWQGFYDWAHGRYHMLEDGYDSWIGDDKS